MSLQEIDLERRWRTQLRPIVYTAQRTAWPELGKACHLAGCAALISHFKPLPKQGRYGGKPPRHLWLALAYTEAAWAYCSPVAVMSAKKKNPPVIARFRAWRTLRLMGYSYPGIASMTGHDHSSVVSGVQKIARDTFTECPFIAADRRSRGWGRATQPQAHVS